MKKSSTWWILGIVAVVSIVFGLVFWQLNEKGSQVQANTWQRGEYPLICPPLPVACGKGENKAHCEQIQDAIVHNNRELSRKEVFQFIDNKDLRESLYYTPPFVYAGVEQTNVHPDALPFIAVVHGPFPEMTQKNGMCDHRLTVLGTRGATFMQKTASGAIYPIRICFQKIQSALQHRITAESRAFREKLRAIRLLSYKGVIAHELMHPYLGGVVKKQPYSLSTLPWIFAHPTYQVGLMAEDPVTLDIGNTTKRVFADIYANPQCQRKLMHYGASE